MIFLPVIEGPKYGNFITKQPIEILESGNYNKVTTISGVTKDDGLLFYPCKFYISGQFINLAVHYIGPNAAGVLKCL